MVASLDMDCKFSETSNSRALLDGTGIQWSGSAVNVLNKSIKDQKTQEITETGHFKSRKKQRRELPSETVAVLKGWLLSPDHVYHPYPTEEEKKWLIRKTGIDMKQLTNWFTNARKRIWKPLMKDFRSHQLISGENGVRWTQRNFFNARSLSNINRGPSTLNSSSCQAQSEASMRFQEHVNKSLHLGSKRSTLSKRDNDSVESEKRKKKKTSLPQSSVQILKEWMMSEEHVYHPYPTDQEKRELCELTGIDLYQLNNWFTNNRKRFWKPKMIAERLMDGGHVGIFTNELLNQQSNSCDNTIERSPIELPSLNEAISIRIRSNPTCSSGTKETCLNMNMKDVLTHIENPLYWDLSSNFNNTSEEKYFQE